MKDALTGKKDIHVTHTNHELSFITVQQQQNPQYRTSETARSNGNSKNEKGLIETQTLRWL